MDEPLERLVAGKVRIVFGEDTRLLTLTPLAGDASSRRYHRAVLDGRSVPFSVVVMELGVDTLPLSSEELALFHEPPKELPFINLHRFLSRIRLRIPMLYGDWIEDRILLLEDLGDRSLWDTVQGLSTAVISSWYEKAIDQLLLLQVQGTRAKDDSCIAFQQYFDSRLYMWEFEHFIEFGLEKGETGTLPPVERKLLTDIFAGISRRLERQKRYLTHRDFHSWNLMIHRGEVAVIDFQDALLAPVQYDLASLLNDRETDLVIRPELERHLLDYYLNRWEEMGEERLGRDEFFEIYLLSALQRDLKVVGRFEYLDRVKGKTGYKIYIPPTLRRLKRNLMRLPDLEKLVAILGAHFQPLQESV